MLGVESSQSRSHITIIIQNFTLVSLTFIVMPHPVGLLLGAMVPSLFMHLTSHHYVYIPAKRIFHLNIYLRLSTCQGMQFVILNYHST